MSEGECEFRDYLCPGFAPNPFCFSFWFWGFSFLVFFGRSGRSLSPSRRCLAPCLCCFEHASCMRNNRRREADKTSAPSNRIIMTIVFRIPRILGCRTESRAAPLRMPVGDLFPPGNAVFGDGNRSSIRPIRAGELRSHSATVYSPLPLGFGCGPGHPTSRSGFPAEAQVCHKDVMTNPGITSSKSPPWILLWASAWPEARNSAVNVLAGDLSGCICRA